ncbi:FmdB family zinc ribbon protein [Actinorugispora endophytica]|uniref:Putative FmdB family regulatory protein n=1 Tax=Actinorugispora endophytica TaxID=1605990 RepID=A0A4R6UC91_9ACTN|nr:FmdB family zinc ribbon protein [Actinorugispora endophytica]TDQ44261.1 putative FmdB family regulatory protein [Actinorugispora endophytica]
MPTYQYACTECGAELEVVQSFSDDALTICPTCQGKLRKVYSAVGIVFKGSGFYRTDSGSSSNSSSLTGTNGSAKPVKAEASSSDSSASVSSPSSDSAKTTAAPAA